MLSTESRRGRRILARLDRGTDLFDSIRVLCREHHIRAGELRGTGALELAELDAFDPARRGFSPARVLGGGGLELLSLGGTISEQDGAVALEARATLMRERDSGLEVVGGHLRRAVVLAVELVIETFDDVLLRRRVDAETGLSLWCEALSEAETAPAAEADLAGESQSGPALAPAPAGALAPAPADALAPAPAPAEEPAPPPVTSPSWSEVAAASSAAAASPAPANRHPASAEEVAVNAGDVILHPQFQRCVVHRVEGSGEFVQVQLRNGRVVRLSLEVLRLTPKGVENGQRIFTASIQ